MIVSSNELLKVVRLLSNVLVIDDEINMREFMSLYLRKEGYHVIEGKNGYDGLQQFNSHHVDLVLLDVMMPIMNGFDVCRQIREHSSVPIIVLTSLESDENHIKGYELGADDYVTKPFKSCILMAKIKRIMESRKKSDLLSTYHYHSLEIDFMGREIHVENVPVKLAPKEFDLLEYLVINRNVVLSRNQILEEVWGFDFEGEIRVVDAHVKKVRKKLGKYMGCIKTVIAIGYKFEEVQFQTVG